MAVDLIRSNGSFVLTGGSTWDTFTTIPTSSAPNDSYMILDVIIFGSLGPYAYESGVAARYQSFYYKNGSGTVSLIDSINTLIESQQYTGSAVIWEYRQQISSNNITIEGKGLIADVTMYYDVKLRTK